MSIYQTQKSTKPKPEDVARVFLDSEKASAFLRLVEYLRVNKIGIPWVSGNSWGLNVKGKRIGFIKIADGNWLFRQQLRHMNFYKDMNDNDMMAFVNSYIRAKTCASGYCNENPDVPKTDFHAPDICTCWPLRIYNPCDNALEQTQRLVTHCKDIIITGI